MGVHVLVLPDWIAAREHVLMVWENLQRAILEDIAEQRHQGSWLPEDGFIISKPKRDRLKEPRVAKWSRVEIRDLWATGQFTHQQIADRYRIHRTTVSRIVRDVHSTRAYRKDRVRELWLTGRHTMAELAEKFHVSRRTVKRLLQGIPKPNRAQGSPEA